MVGASAGKQDVEQRLHHAAELRAVAGGGTELVEFEAPLGRQTMPIHAEHPGNRQGVVARRHQGFLAREQVGDRAVLIDGIVEHDRIHRERQGVLQLALRPQHDLLHPLLRLELALRCEDEAHATARHAAQHPESPKVIAEGLGSAGDQLLREMGGSPRDDRLDRPAEVAGRRCSQTPDVALAKRVDHLIEQPERILSPGPFRRQTEEILLRDHFQDGPDVLGHTAVHDDEGILEGAARGFGNLIAAVDVVRGHQPTTGNSELRIILAGGRAGDELDAWPDAAGILPTAAGAAEPLAEKRPGEDEPSFRFRQRPGQRSRLSRGTHADADQRPEEVRAHRQSRTLRDVVHAGDDLQTPARSDQCRQKVLKRMPRTLDPRGNDTRRDDRRLEQAEVILGEIEHVGKRRDVRGRSQVDRRQSKHRFVQHPQPRADRRTGAGIATVDTEVDRDVQDLGAFRIIHPEEEDVGPRRVGQVHADRSLFAQDRIRTIRGGLQQFGPDAQGLVDGMPHAEHPLIAPDGADTATDLIRERLEGQPMIGRGQGGTDAVAGAFGLLLGQEGIDRLLESTMEQVLESAERNQPTGAPALAGEHGGKMEAMQGVQEEQRANPLVEVGGATPEAVQFGSELQQSRRRRAGHDAFQGEVPHLRPG